MNTRNIFSHSPQQPIIRGDVSAGQFHAGPSVTDRTLVTSGHNHSALEGEFATPRCSRLQGNQQKA